MENYKKSKEHVTNAALAFPFILATGNIIPALFTLGIGKLLDYAEDKDFERRQEEWKNNPHRHVNLTLDEVCNQIDKNKEISDIINDLPEIRNAKILRGCPSHKNSSEIYIHIGGYEPLQYSNTGIGEGSITFHNGLYDTFGKKYSAKLYYNERDFLNTFKSDLKHGNIVIYKLIATGYKKGHWMYTKDGGNSFIVGL